MALLTLATLCNIASAQSPTSQGQPANSATTAAAANLSKNAISAEKLFAGKVIPRIHIEISQAAMNQLRRSSGWGDNRNRPTVQCKVYEGDQVYTNVSIHLKGSAGSFRSVDDTPNLTLNFAAFAKGQRFHGLKKLSLNNSIQDPSYICEKISRELLNEAGIPTARAGHAKVQLNGIILGLYVLVEGYNKQFLHRHFKDVSGNFYDGGFMQDIQKRLHVVSGARPRDQNDLQRLADAAAKLPEDRIAALANILDLNRFYSLLAVEVITCNWNGYAMHKNNWRLYHDMDQDRMIFLAHGMDQMFGVSMVGPDMSIFPPMRGSVARAVMTTTEGRRRYLERLERITTNLFQHQRMTNRVNEIAATIRPYLTEGHANAARHFDQQVRWLNSRIVSREMSLRKQLSAPAQP